MRWFTQSLETESNDSEFLFQLREVLTDSIEVDIRRLMEKRVKLYEALLYRTERVFVVGDYTFWYSYPESATNILEMVEGDDYIRINLVGFYQVEARTLALKVGNLLVERVPPRFEVKFGSNSSLTLSESTSSTAAVTTPNLASISASPEEIFFGSLCTGEIAQLEIYLINSEVVNNVLLVYRLTSQVETNQNWTTVFMELKEPGVYRKIFNAELDFGAYQLTDEAEMEAYVGVLYGVDQVYNSPVYQLLKIKRCGEQTPTAATPIP
jgi:hypothetical protein